MLSRLRGGEALCGKKGNPRIEFAVVKMSGREKGFHDHEVCSSWLNTRVNIRGLASKLRFK